MRRHLGENTMVQTGRVSLSRMGAVSFGRPAAEVVAEEACTLGAHRVFLMVSHTLNNTTDEIEKVRVALGNLCSGTFDRMAPHTPKADVMAATRAAREAGADLIVTVGGGSITDGAKAVRLCLANDIDTPEGIDALRPEAKPDGTLGPPDGVKAPMVKQITVPTTLSGGEFSAIAGVTDEHSRTKELIRHAGIIPHAVVLDPSVTLHTPEWLWLSTGVRAVDHCVEGVCATEAHAYGDAQALQGLKLLSSGLPRVNADPNDLDARLDCQMGTWLSMAPLSSGVAYGREPRHRLRAGRGLRHTPRSHLLHHAPGGDAMEPPGERRAQELVAAAMGHPDEDADVLDTFIGGLGIPRSLAAGDIGPEDFERIAEQAMGTPWVPHNPRSIDGPAQVMEILVLAA